MSVFHNNALIGSGGGAAEAGAAGVGVRSLRFNSSDTAHLSKTFGSSGDRDNWTWSGWVKRSALVGSERHVLFGGYGANSDTGWLEFGFGQGSLDGNDTVYLTTSSISDSSTAVFRDFSAWYHYLANYDGSNFKVYINNTLVLTKALTGDRGINGNWLHTIGKSPANTIRYFNGYLTDVYFIDGLTLNPSSFGSTDSNGVWQRGTYSGTFGTNGFHLLDFENEGTIGHDSSGNNNDFTADNLSDTAGAGNDVLLDFPVNGSESDTGAGGEVSGNYAVLNPLQNGLDLSNGNLSFAIGSRSDWKVAAATIHITSGKWYWEITNGTQNTAGGNIIYGLRATDASSPLVTTGSTTAELGYNDGNKGYMSSALKRDGGSGTTSYGASFGTGDVIGVAFDADAGSLVFYKNGVSQGTAFTGLTGSWAPAVALYTGGTQLGTDDFHINFGQRAFTHSAPSNHKALNTASISAASIADGSDYFDIALYNGNETARSITGFSFSPDLVWLKNRDRNAYNHYWVDIIRGDDKNLFSNLNEGEQDAARLSSFDSNGFGLTNHNGVNKTGDDYVAWCFEGGSSTASNTSGSITSSVRASAASGFSIVTWTGNGSSSASVGHGLSAAPDIVVIKCRSSTTDWHTYVRAVDANGRYQVYLNKTDGKTDFGSNFFSGGSSTISLNSSSLGINQSGSTYVAYCFAPVANYSAMGAYTGNGSTDGPFVHLGFRARFILFKNTTAGQNWRIMDTARNTFNVVDNILYPNLGNAEQSSAVGLDILSNGFKIKESGSELNDSGDEIIYAAFAENPFQANGGLAR